MAHVKINVMFRRISIGLYLFLFFAISTHGYSELIPWQDIVVPESSDQQMILRSGDIELKGRWVEPLIVGHHNAKRQWTHISRTTFDKMLPPCQGQVTEDRYTAEGLELVRQFWVSKTNDCAAIRMTIWNTGQHPIRLDAIRPWQSIGDSSIRLGDGMDSSQWELVVQAWRKNGDPRAIIPKSGWTRDVDQFMLMHARNRTELPTVRLGYLEQMGHLAQVRIEFDDANGKTQLKALTSRCLFDGCEIPPGGSRTSNWLMFTLHTQPGESMHEYAERVANYYGLKQPGPPPTVWCSWYYYGDAMNEGDIHEILDYLKAKPLPFDVLQLDSGWYQHRGDWFASDSDFPSGMKDMADRMRQLGYQPGLWVSPFLVRQDSNLFKEHPEWLLRYEDGTYQRGNQNACVLDTTYPGVCDWLEKTFRRLTFDDGYTYYKLDFLRAVMRKIPGYRDEESPRLNYYDKSATRVEVYRRGLEAIRRGTGPDAYLTICGGNFGASLGIAQSQHCSSDISAVWEKSGETVEEANEVLMRTWMNRLWHTDPEALAVRWRPKEHPRFGKMALGTYSYEEACTISLKQYLAGGMAIVTDNLNEISNDRLEIYKHVIPSMHIAGIVLDPFKTVCASKVLTRVKPVCQNLGQWVTVAAMNWADSDQPFEIQLDDTVLESIPADRYLVSEFFSKKVLGLYKPGDTIDLNTLKAHNSRLLRITPWNSKTPVLAGTDLHYSGGGVEITDWQVNTDGVSGTLKTQWRYPVTITVAFPANDAFTLKSMTLNPGQKRFWIPSP